MTAAQHGGPRGTPRETRGRVARYSFLVRNFHPLLPAGLSRRTLASFADFLASFRAFLASFPAFFASLGTFLASFAGFSAQKTVRFEVVVSVKLFVYNKSLASFPRFNIFFLVATGI